VTVTLVFAGRLCANAVGWAFCGVTDKNPLVLKENQPPVLAAMAARAGGFCDILILGNTAQRLCDRCVVKFFVR
jgi:lipoate synthase